MNRLPNDDAIPEGTCLHGNVTSLFRGNLDGRCHTYMLQQSSVYQQL
jgi:hypothetical protein